MAKVLAGATAMMTMIMINRCNMRRILFVLLPALLVFSGCAKEKPQKPDTAPVFTGVIEQGITTKSTVSYNPAIMRYLVNWESSDEVRINGAKYSVTPGSPETRATFTKVEGDTPAGTFKACVPYDKTNYDGGTMKVTFPATINNVYHDISFWPMYAESTSTELAFKNLAGLVAISILKTDAAVGVKSVTISSENNFLSGTASIAEDGAGWKAELSSGGNSVTVNCATPLSITSWDYVFIPVPPKNYGADFKITITYTDDSSLEKAVKADHSINVQRSKVTSIAFNLCSPDSTENEDIIWGESYTEADFN